MELAVRRWGNGPRRALLVHGLSSNADGWWRVAPAIAEWGYEVAAPDLRGHGASDPGEEYSLEAYAADLLRLGGGWDLALGHSLGGAAVALAARELPDFARKIVLEDPALIIPDPGEALAWLVEPYLSEISADSVAESNPTWHPEDARIKAEALLQSGRDVVEQTVAHNLPWNVIEAVLGIDVPTLLVGADPGNGAIVPSSLGENLAANNPALEYVLVPGGSHSIHRDEFEAFMEAIRPFVVER